MKTKTLFKIYHPTSRLYSAGGKSVKWDKDGKTWDSFSEATKHIMEFSKKKTNPYKLCKLVVYSPTEEYNFKDMEITKKALVLNKKKIPSRYFKG